MAVVYAITTSELKSVFKARKMWTGLQKALFQRMFAKIYEDKALRDLMQGKLKAAAPIEKPVTTTLGKSWMSALIYAHNDYILIAIMAVRFGNGGGGGGGGGLDTLADEGHVVTSTATLTALEYGWRFDHKSGDPVWPMWRPDHNALLSDLWEAVDRGFASTLRDDAEFNEGEQVDSSYSRNAHERNVLYFQCDIERLQAIISYWPKLTLSGNSNEKFGRGQSVASERRAEYAERFMQTMQGTFGGDKTVSTAFNPRWMASAELSKQICESVTPRLDARKTILALPDWLPSLSSEGDDAQRPIYSTEKYSTYASATICAPPEGCASPDNPGDLLSTAMWITKQGRYGNDFISPSIIPEHHSPHIASTVVSEGAGIEFSSAIMLPDAIPSQLADLAPRSDADTYRLSRPFSNLCDGGARGELANGNCAAIQSIADLAHSRSPLLVGPKDIANISSASPRNVASERVGMH